MRGLIIHDEAPGPPDIDKRNVLTHEKRELAMRTADLEKAGSKRFETDKTALEKAQKRMAGTTCLLLYRKHHSRFWCFLCWVIEDKSGPHTSTPCRATEKTSALEAPPPHFPWYPELPCTAPPSYEPSINPYNLPSIQALIVEVKGGTLDLDLKYHWYSQLFC